MNRLIDQIFHQWKAYKFPQCEQAHFIQKLKKYLSDPHFEHIQDDVSDVLEDYLKFVKDFIKMETAIRNFENQRQLKLKQLIQVSENYTDLKKFEVQAP